MTWNDPYELLLVITNDFSKIEKKIFRPPKQYIFLTELGHFEWLLFFIPNFSQFTILLRDNIAQ